MKLFRKMKISDLPPVHFKRLYQYADGVYLPDSSQPDSDDGYAINTRAYTPHASTRYLNVVNESSGKPRKYGKNNDKDLPELYKIREDCCGCTACYALCPVQAIVMRPCEEGFLYPVVDAAKCIRCYKCINVCPIKGKDKDMSKLKQ